MYYYNPYLKKVFVQVAGELMFVGKVVLRTNKGKDSRFGFVKFTGFKKVRFDMKRARTFVIGTDGEPGFSESPGTKLPSVGNLIVCQLTGSSNSTRRIENWGLLSDLVAARLAYEQELMREPEPLAA